MVFNFSASSSARRGAASPAGSAAASAASASLASATMPIAGRAMRVISSGVEVDADHLDVAVEPPARLRLVEAGADRQHDIGAAPQIMARRAGFARGSGGR